MNINELKNKQLFVQNLNDVIAAPNGVRGIKQLRYEVYQHAGTDTVREYLIIVFVGDAISVRNQSGNSHSAILQDIGDLCSGGYYDEVRWYEEITGDTNWKQII